jgi:hypothetical protein
VQPAKANTSSLRFGVVCSANSLGCYRRFIGAGGLIDSPICARLAILENGPDTFNLGEIGSLMVAMSHYSLEADRYETAEAHLASCIMLSAAIEEQLTICMSLLSDEAEAALKRGQQAGKIKKSRKLTNLLRWDLGDLLLVADEAGWLPKRLERFPFPRPPQDGDPPLSADLVRVLRNLVHPGNLIRERNCQPVTQAELDLLHETCFSIYAYLAQKLSPDAFNPEMPGPHDRI